MYRHHILKLDQFHPRCLRKIARIKWQEHVPNTTVLKICNISGIETLLQTVQLRWCGHVIRMDKTRIPKQVLYGQLHHGFRRSGGQYKRYNNCLKSTMTQCGITSSELETIAMDRAGWRFTCKSAGEEFEVRRIQELEATIHQQLRVPDLPPDVSLTDWASCPQQVTLVMMRIVVSTAQSMISTLMINVYIAFVHSHISCASDLYLNTYESSFDKLTTV